MSASFVPSWHQSIHSFKRVFLVNLPERTNKLDTFSLTASLTGFSVELTPGVKGELIPNKSLPAVEGLPLDESLRNNVVGCWRAHLNFAREYATFLFSSPLLQSLSKMIGSLTMASRPHWSWKTMLIGISI